MAAQALVAKFLETFQEYPPRQKAASFTIDQILEKMSNAAGYAHKDSEGNIDGEKTETSEKRKSEMPPPKRHIEGDRASRH